MDHALELFANITERTLADSAGDDFTLPPAILADTWQIRLGFFDVSAGLIIPRELNVLGVRVNLGYRLTPPSSGTFKLRANGTDTAALDFDITDTDLLTAIASATSVTNPAAGCFIVTGPTTLIASPDSVSGYNLLQPASFVRVREITENGVTSFEVRLIQQPYAFADTYERVLAAAPGVDSHAERVFAGAEATDEAPALNEVQKLKIPAEFRGTYYLTHDYRRTKVLSYLDGAAAIAEALNALWDDGEVRFVVTVPESQYVYIEFSGELGGQPQDLLAVTVHSEPPGAITVVLPLDRNAFATALRTVDEIEEVPFEIEVTYIGDDEEAEDEGVVAKKLTIQTTVTCRREGIFDELALYPTYDWLRPASDVRYEAASTGQILTGHTDHYEVAIGDGVATSFSITHNLDTLTIANIVVSENVTNGRVLALGSEYQAEINSANEITLYFAGTAPTSNALRVVITASGPEAIYEAHNHSATEVFMEGEVPPDGETVQDAIETLAGRITALEAVVGPTGGALSVSISSLAAIQFDVPDWEPDPLPPYNTIALPGSRTFTQFTPLPIAILTGITHGVDLGGAITISTSSVADPSEITTATDHGLVSGQTVTIAGHTGSTPAVDGTYVITVTGSDTFTIDLNVTSGGTGGTVTADTLLATGTLGEIRHVAATTYAPERNGLEPVRFEVGTDIVWNGRFWQAVVAPLIATFTVNAGTDVITTAQPHELAVDARVRFASDDTLPAGLAAETYYFVKTVPSSTTFTVSTTSGGSAVDITDTGTGTHSAYVGAWYPEEFEETIGGTQVTAAQLAAGTFFSWELKPKFKLLGNTRGIARLVIEHAQRSVEAGGHLNLEDLTWTRAKSFTLALGPSLDEQRITWRVTRALAGTLSSIVRYYNSQETLAAAATPASAEFFARVRFGQFDVQNLTAPEGSLLRECKEMVCGITPG